MRKMRFVIIAMLMLVYPCTSVAHITCGPLVGNHMVLQQQTDVRLLIIFLIILIPLKGNKEPLEIQSKLAVQLVRNILLTLAIVGIMRRIQILRIIGGIRIYRSRTPRLIGESSKT